MEQGDGPSTRRLELIPPPDQLLVRCRAIALLEAGLSQNPQSRWHTFSRSETGGTCRVSDGSGNEALYWFDGDSAVIRGFDHESPISPWAQEPMGIYPGVHDHVPPSVERAPTIVVADVESVTFCTWWSDGRWQCGPVEFPPSVHADPDGSEYLLQPISSAESARSFLVDYYETDVPLDAVSSVFSAVPLDERLAEAIALRSSVGQVIAAASEIGYPLAQISGEAAPPRRRWWRRRG